MPGIRPLATHNDLALILADLGELAEARRLQKQVVADRW